MPRGHRRGAKGGQPVPPAAKSRVGASWIVLVPVLVVVVLNLPNLGLGYFWDDFYFLTGHGGIRNYLLPDPGTAFYRPIPQAVYFAFLRLVDPASGLVGHIVNLVVLAGAIALLVLLVRRLCGARAGLFSGLVLAGYGHIPSLVAWVSASQDLFAIALVLAAFYLRHQGKDVLALSCAAAGLLCKEPAIAAFPVLVLWDWIVGRPASRPRLQVIGYTSVALLWGLMHPGIRLLLARGFQSGATGYVGIESPERWGLYIARYVLSLLNVPPPGLDIQWLESLAPYGFLALAILVLGVWYLDRRWRTEGARFSLKPVAVIAALFSIPTLLMPAILIRHWAPYFACIPAVGMAILLGPVLARQRSVIAIVALTLFLLLGIWYRGASSRSELVWSEPVFVEASGAVRTVRSNFANVFPTFPKGSQVVVSVGTSGIRGIQSTMIDGQALSVWYRDPTLRTVTTLGRRPGARSEFLVRVTTELDVIGIDPETRRVRASRPEEPDFAEINRPVNNYARALAASGETDRAVRILDGLAGDEPGPNAAYDRRMIASIFLAAGRLRESDSLLATTPSFPREDALVIVKRLLGEATPNEKLDEAAFEAFGLSRNDPETIRWMMREFQRDGSAGQAAWLALRLQQLRPGDQESAEVVRDAARRGIKPQREPT